VSAAEPMADGKWWCDGEDCVGDITEYPHVHCEMHSHPVDLRTGTETTPWAAKASRG
jgi:hypothetical protein